MGFVMKGLLNNCFPADEMKEGAVGVVQNVRIPEGFINILIESDCDHNLRLKSHELLSAAVLLFCGAAVSVRYLG